jgi:anti-anti-sigma factor
MDLSRSEHGPVVVVEPAGAIAKRGAGEFESAMLELLDGGHDLLAVDFSKVELIASEGIRVLMLLSQRLEACGGGLVLCALGRDVLGVFDVTGLTERFQIVETQAEAIARLSSNRDSASAPTRSTVTRLVGRLLGSPSTDGAADSAASGQPSQLTRQVADLFTRSG